MGRNFLIVYTSREGSSAIVQRLSCHSDIVVPLFEELDRYWIDKFYASVDICKELDDVYTTGQFRLKHDYARKSYLEQNTKPELAASVGFKWRPHGPWSLVLDVLCKHNVVVMDLLRCDLLELTCSLYISRVTKSDDSKSAIGHSQFEITKMSKEEADQYRQKIESTKTPMRPLLFFSLMVWRVWKALRNKLFCWRARRRGLETKTIFYEDFSREPEAFIRQISNYVDVPYRVASHRPKRAFKKATTLPAKRRIQNMWVVRYNPLTYVLIGIYGLLTTASRGDQMRREQGLSSGAEKSGASSPH